MTGRHADNETCAELWQSSIPGWNRAAFVTCVDVRVDVRVGSFTHLPVCVYLLRWPRQQWLSILWREWGQKSLWFIISELSPHSQLAASHSNIVVGFSMWHCAKAKLKISSRWKLLASHLNKQMLELWAHFLPRSDHFSQRVLLLYRFRKEFAQFITNLTRMSVLVLIIGWCYDIT